ncbi:hypothetical protein ABZX77_18735 [Streptomyces sp. NPDC004237]|uniref:MmyB family transcriptional regulator n=1 Tax=Streptomyces sp. NPDC004237 TaxID=3154455 RepID=UPI0033BA58BD
MAYQAGGRRPVPRPVPESLEAQAYLQDYALLLDAVPFPSLVVDHRWDVVLANSAFETLFRGIAPHPTAMPGDNFLRFVLFHPEVGSVLGAHEAGWCLPMLAQFKTTLERYGHDHELQSIRREIAQDPIMEAAFRHGLPHWLRAVGEQGAQLDGAVRLLLHPDPLLGVTECRVVGETPKTLCDMGYARYTLVLRDSPRPAATPRRSRRPGGLGAHLAVVPVTEA